MNFRHTMKGRRALTAVAITTGLVLTVAGCGGGDDDGKSGSSSSAPAKSDEGEDKQGKESPAAPSGEPLATAKDGDITVTVTSAERDAGGFVTVSGSVKNDGDRSWLGANWASDERELRSNGGSLSGASLVDNEGKKKYLVLRDTSGRCLCTKFSGQISPGDTASWYAQFPAPPEGTNKVSFQVGSMPPASVELSEGE
ncbi:DUF4352 domain-containing protein [Streptomyces montanus]|uniref:DUF4352 domain-containing protein n=1 Tax=Streptomyces montanus TaxID=2580423 RepID=A0A5R9FW60_9ACTN|nr:DUF4352 domain-containing protein [Streptomyces montanus]TLS45113.1 DUF4352 domain-containing protein [Streptomyces montanus]